MKVKHSHTILLPQENLVGSGEATIVAPVTQLHLYCPVCGEVWAHFLSNHPTPRHAYHPLPCRTHGNGTVLLHFHLDSLSSQLLPREVILRRQPLLSNYGLPYAATSTNEP